MKCTFKIETFPTFKTDYMFKEKKNKKKVIGRNSILSHKSRTCISENLFKYMYKCIKRKSADSFLYIYFLSGG